LAEHLIGDEAETRLLELADKLEADAAAMENDPQNPRPKPPAGART
jgi:hypothetical protein